MHTQTHAQTHACVHTHIQMHTWGGQREADRPQRGEWQQAVPPRLQTAPPHPGLGGAADVAASITWRAGCVGSAAHQPSGEPRPRGLQRGVENGEGSAVLMTAACTPRAARANSIAL